MARTSPGGAGVQPRQVRFGGSNRTSVKQEAFDRLAQGLLDRFGAAETRTSRHLWETLEVARLELAARGSVSETQATELRDCVARDLNHLAAVLLRGPQDSVEKLRRRASQGPEGHALRVLLEVLEMCGDAMYRLSSDYRSSAVRRAGEVTCAGGVSCAHCQLGVRSSRSWIIEACRACGSRDFLRWP